MNEIIKHADYRDWIGELKQQIQRSQIKAALSVNSQLIMLYWDLGRQIVEKQENARWGSGFIKQMSKDLRDAFPDLGGFSVDNLTRMRQFYMFYSQVRFLEQVVPKIEIANPAILEQVVPKLLTSEIEEFIKTTQVVSQNYEQLVQNLISIPWGHHILIMKKIKNTVEALGEINVNS